ncbi:MAG: hypothetical protein FWF92_07725 [Oscillospiraceae bacterium]|nr:hypothetical protein [Oscillospiraceae bacterium]
MKKIRIISFGLIVLLIFLSLSITGCQTKNESKDDSGDSAVNEDINHDQEEAAEEIDYITQLGETYNFDGYEFRIMVPAAENHMPDSGPALYMSEAMNGEIVNDALYTRNKAVEAALNIKITVFEHSPGGILETYKAIVNSVSANDKTFDVAIPHVLANVDAMTTGGYLCDWNKITSVDFDNPWWNIDAMNAYSMAHKKFLGMGEVNFGNYSNTYAMFFNKDFIQKYDLENPYELVKAKKWTIDKVLEITKDMYQDLNSNGKSDADDLYGYSGSATGVLLGFMYGSNITYFKTDENGAPYISFINEKTDRLVDKMVSLYYQDNRSYIYDNNEIDIFNAMQEGRMFLQGDKIGQIIKLRGADIEFGILPYPLYDENQDKYYTYVDAWGGVLCIPNNVLDDELNRTAVILDALSYETLKNVKPKYYDIALKTKYARDDESAEMLDLLYGGLVFDLGYVYDKTFEYFSMFMNSVTRGGNKFMTSMDRIEGTVQKYLDNAYEKISGLD